MGQEHSLHNLLDNTPNVSKAIDSVELQRLIDNVLGHDLYQLKFSVTIADPTVEDCPLVGCSIGFAELTGYTVDEIVGRNCRFLLNGVPEECIDVETRMKARAYCQSYQKQQPYDGERQQLPEGLRPPWLDLNQGEMICVQTNRRKTGELFRNMFYLREVNLDDEIYIVGLQAIITEELDDETEKLQTLCQNAFRALDENMTAIEMRLAAQFWYSAPMRRQVS